MLVSSYITPKARKGVSSAIEGRGLVAVAPIAVDELVAIKGATLSLPLLCGPCRNVSRTPRSTREELLTRLITEAYDSIGAAAEDSQRGLPSGDPPARFAAACRAIRAWALAHPHEYSLVFGSPIPGYQAPEQTVPSAARVPGVLGAILLDAAKRRAGERHQQVPLTDAGRRAITPALELFAHQIPAEQTQAGLMVWSGLFGAISFELFGHQYGSVGQAPQDRDAFFESCIAAWAAQAGIS
jgi:hypothetical protein